LAATRENSSRAPSAFWKLPGPGNPPAPCSRSGPILALAPRIVRPPPPTPALYAGHAACDAADGSETSVLLEPRSSTYDTTILLESNWINQFFHVGPAMVLTPAPQGLGGESLGFALRPRGFFGPVRLANPSDSICGDEAPSASSGARGVTPAGPRSPADLATLAPARGQVAAPRNLGGKSLPAADLPNDAAGESAARVDSLAAWPKRTRIRAIRKIQRWGIRGAPHHPLRWS
jgi:hypothetical protein